MFFRRSTSKNDGELNKWLWRISVPTRDHHGQEPTSTTIFTSKIWHTYYCFKKWWNATSCISNQIMMTNGEQKPTSKKRSEITNHPAYPALDHGMCRARSSAWGRNLGQDWFQSAPFFPRIACRFNRARFFRKYRFKTLWVIVRTLTTLDRRLTRPIVSSFCSLPQTIGLRQSLQPFCSCDRKSKYT